MTITEHGARMALDVRVPGGVVIAAAVDNDILATAQKLAKENGTTVKEEIAKIFQPGE